MNPVTLLDKYDKPGPRYTSYPTVPVWSKDFGQKRYQDALSRYSSCSSPTFSVYLHLPFCARRCHYCGCNAVTAESPASVDAYLDAVSEIRPFNGRGLISPHIDFERGGRVYAKVWGNMTDAARQAEVAVILGTDHNGGEGTLTLTRQNYATPYGVLPTASDIVDTVADAIGPQLALKRSYITSVNTP